MSINIIYTAYDLALLFHSMFKNKYVCSSLKNNEWFYFENHKWNLDNNGASLYSKISTDLINEYNKKCKELLKDVSNEQLIDYLKLQKATTDKLKSTSFKMSVLTESAHLFYDKDFINKLDENRNLICFTNGIFDLVNNKFRDGKPTDYISLSTNNEYIKFNSNDRYIKSLLNYFDQVFTNKDIKEYVLNLLSSYLQGHNPHEKFIIWTGTGANSKSKLIELLCLSLGEYAGVLPVSLLTHKRSACGVASPELAMTKGKRFIYFQEPEETDKINVGLMKELTGNDKISARQLFKEPIEFKPQFKLVLCCNKLPFIPSSDGGTWRRLRVVNFSSKFVNEPKKENEFKIDPYLSENFEKWKVSLMSILIDRFENYKNKGIVEPDDVLKYTMKYKADSDIYLQFFIDKLNKQRDNKININELYQIFKIYYKEVYNKRPPSRNEFKKYIDDNYIDNVKQNYLYGFNYKESNDSISNGLDD